MADKKRISKVTTKTGDRGNTKLATGRTISKGSAVVQAIGSVDELNSHVGLLVSLLTATPQTPTADIHQADEQVTHLADVQQALFDIGAVFAMEGDFAPPSPSALEEITTQLNAQLPPLTEFVIPGGGVMASQTHICRTVCRRAESDIWRLKDNWSVLPEGIIGAAQYLNRLSDYFFVLARSLTATAESQWQGPSKNRPKS